MWNNAEVILYPNNNMTVGWMTVRLHLMTGKCHPLQIDLPLISWRTAYIQLLKEKKSDGSKMHKCTMSMVYLAICTSSDGSKIGKCIITMFY